MTVLPPLSEPSLKREQALLCTGILINSPPRPQIFSSAVMLQGIGYYTRESGDLNSTLRFFLIIPFLGASSCSAYTHPRAFTCSCSVNHHHCFIMWSQVESIKNVKMSNHILLRHPCFHCINYGLYFVQHCCKRVPDEKILLWGCGRCTYIYMLQGKGAHEILERVQKYH